MVKVREELRRKKEKKKVPQSESCKPCWKKLDKTFKSEAGIITFM